MPGDAAMHASMQSQISDNAIFVNPNDSMFLSSRKSGLARAPSASSGHASASGHAYASGTRYSHDGHAMRTGSMISGVNPVGVSARDSEGSAKETGSRRGSTHGLESSASSSHAQVPQVQKRRV